MLRVDDIRIVATKQLDEGIGKTLVSGEGGHTTPRDR
jgi:hypothetical protein